MDRERIGAGPRRRKSVLGTAAALLGAAVTFVGTAAISLVLHLDAPPARRLAAAQLNQLLEGTFQGRIVLERIGHLGLDGVGGVRARVLDPEGRQVLFVDSLRARVSVIDAARSAILGQGDLEITLTDAELAHADVLLDADQGTGELHLARAFLPRDESPADPNARPLRFVIEKALIHHAWAHGQMKGAPAIDADIEDVDGRVEVTDPRTRIEIASLYLTARGMPEGLDPRGAIEGRLDLPTEGEVAVEASFDGDVRGLPVSASGVLDGDHLDARLDVREVAGEQVRAVIANAPVYGAVAAEVEVSGTLPVLDVRALVRMGRGIVGAKAQVGLGDEIWIDGSARARNIDARAFAPTSPATDLGADIDLQLTLATDGQPRGTVDVATVPGWIDGQPLPAIQAHSDVRGERVTGEARIHEPGAPARLRWDLQQNAKVLDFDLQARAPHLEAVTRLQGKAGGRAELSAKGRIDLARGAVSAELSASSTDLRSEVALARTVDVSARAEGPIDAPRIDASVRAQHVTAGGYRFVDLRVAAEGPVGEPRVRVTADGPDLPRIAASTSVRLRPEPAARELAMVLSRGEDRVVVRADRVGTRGRAVEVEGLVVEGLGEPIEASLSMGPGVTTLRAKGSSVDLGRVARLARISDRLQAGRASFDVDLALRPGEMRGDVRVDVDKVSIGRVQDASGHLDARLMGRQLFGNANVRAGKLMAVYLNTSTLEIGGSPLEPRSWRTATGAVQLDADVDLGQVARLVPREMLPVGELSGKVTVEGEVKRVTAREHPALDLSVRTERLVLAGVPAKAGQVDHTPVVEKPPWRISGLDLAIDARLDAERKTAAVQGNIHDERGVIVAVDASARVGVRDVIDAPGGPMAALERAPFHVRLQVPKRSLASLPPVLKLSSTKGTAEVDIEASGTALEPEVHGKVTLGDFRDPRVRMPYALDATLGLDYAAGRGDAKLSVRTPEGEVLRASSEIHADVAELIHPPAGGEPSWRASAEAQLNRLPLDAIGALADSDLAGHVSGKVTLKDLHRDARADARIDIDDLRVGRVRYSGGFVTFALDDRALQAAARLEQQDGHAEARARLGARWGAALVPTIDRKQPGEITLQAKNFRAGVARPFVEDTFSQLDGRITGNARMRVGAGGAHTSMSGQFALRQGLFQLRTVGEEFKNARADLVIREDGTIRLEKFSADGSTGRIEAAAAARVNGLHFVGARAKVHIPKDRPVPLAVEGEPLGELSGDVDVSARMSQDEKRLDVRVEVPRIRTQLPDFAAAKVQKLDPGEHIRIGTYRAPPKQFTLIPLGPPRDTKPATGEPLVVKVDVNLRDVEVRQGTMLRVRLRGRPTIEMDGGEPKVRGTIQLLSGTLEVQGKRFEIERGTVTFVGDPANPEVVVTASWEAPDRTKVYADFVGPIETGKVTLRSEPPLPQSEILSLIVFGTADGANATPAPGQEPDGSTRAVGMGGGVATKGLNAALEDMTDLDVQARIDTSSANPRPELELQVSRSVSVAIAHVLGLPPPGSNPDKNLLRLDWRFRQNWSFETTVGDRGSSIFDVVWRKRY